MSATTHLDLQTWSIDASHSEAGFAVKHLMISTVKGSFRNVSGVIVLDPSNLEASSVKAVIDASSIDTRSEQRDEHLRAADFFDVATYPAITFRSHTIESKGDGEYSVIGDLTIRDITKEVVLDVEETGRATDPWGAQKIAFVATTKIDRTEFGLTWNQALEAGGVLVANEIKITLDIQAALS